jgi:hypothetical protein
MSLPPAKKEVSEHPAPGSVTVPVDKREKDQDVDRKIRFYGVIEAFRNCRLPSNEQIDKTLQYVLAHSPVHTDRLSPEGKNLINDVREIVETARLMVLQKNADELFQYFVWHTREVDREKLAPGDASEKSPVSAQKAKEDSREAIRHLRTLLHLILTNSEIRKLLSDFSVIGRDLLAKGAHKVADVIAPHEEALRGVDKPAPQESFVSEGGRQVGPGEAPVMATGTAASVDQHPKEGQVKFRDANGNERLKAEDRKDQMSSQGPGVKEAGTTEESEKKRQGLIGKMKDVRDNLLDRVPTEHKEKAHEHAERGKKFLTEEYFPEERREQFIFRGKKVIIECQKHDDYQESMQWLIDLVEEYAKHGRGASKGVATDAKGSFISDPNLKQAIDELRTLLERFANQTSLDMITDAVNTLIDDANQDERLRAWFLEVRTYLRKVLLEPGYVLEDGCNREADRLRESGREFFEGKYKGHIDNLFDSVGTWFKAMGEDPINKRFGEDWARLMKDLLFDSEGSLAFKSGLWGDIRKVILPEIVDKVGYIPIPRIEYSDESLDLVVENLTLSGRNLFPNIMSIEAHNFFKFSPYDAIKDVSHHTFTFTLDQMQADMRDVAFFYRKKTGIPKMTDSGIADVIVGGNGLHATIVLTSANRKDKSSVFSVREVHVKVESLKFSIRDSKHDFLYKTLRPLASALIKRQLQKVIADVLRTLFEYVDGQLVTVRDRMEAAKATEGQSRTDVLKELFKKKGSGEESVKTTESQSHFKVVANKRNSILVREGHPAGWVNRMAEKETAAERGSEWRSDAFNIV